MRERGSGLNIDQRKWACEMGRGRRGRLKWEDEKGLEVGECEWVGGCLRSYNENGRVGA